MMFVPHCVKSWGDKKGLHFYKETDKIYKNALFLEFLAYLHLVVWLNSPELEVKSNLS